MSFVWELPEPQVTHATNPAELVLQMTLNPPDTYSIPKDKSKDQLIAELAALRCRITELEAAESQPRQEEKAEQEGWYRLLFEMANDIIFIHPFATESKSARFTAVNDVACQVLGYTREELLQLSPLANSATPPEPQPALLDLKGGTETILVVGDNEWPRSGRPAKIVTIPIESINSGFRTNIRCNRR